MDKMSVRPEVAPVLAPIPVPGRRIRVMVVDDSGFMRLAIRKMIDRTDGIEVVGEAREGKTAVDMAKRLAPDVITMDLEMPGMDGLAATKAIMKERPVPIIVVSSLTQPGAEQTLRALKLGAVDFISKSSSFVQLDIVQIDQELRRKILHWAKPQPLARSRPSVVIAANYRPIVAPAAQVDLVVVGVSTGGPKIMAEFLHTTGTLHCPMIIAQHMPQLFTTSFARHLAFDTGLDVIEGTDGMELRPGQVVILPGGVDSAVRRRGGRLVLARTYPDEGTIHPSVDALFASALTATTSPVAVVMTGMGRDGTLGAKAFAAKCFPVLVQAPETCVVSGMPNSVIEAGVSPLVLTLAEIGRRLVRWCVAPGKPQRPWPYPESAKGRVPFEPFV
ncbi:MAG: chemotaxis-specific protein-glutamate methyltransferase CheB [Rhodospirillaceae bacterium]